MAWDPAFVNPNIDAITMTYGYMRNYEDRVRRAVNTPDRERPLRALAGRHGAQHPGGLGGGRRGRHEAGGGRRRARAARGRQRQVGGALEDGAHRAAGLGAGRRRTTSSAARSRRSTYTRGRRRRRWSQLEPAPRTVRGARDLLSVALQYGNAFGQGFQAAALKPADFFGNDDVLYLMEDMATGEIRLSILWEWLHKGARLTEDDAGDRRRARATPFTAALFARLLDEEYAKLLRREQPRRPRRLEDDDAADRARDRRGLRRARRSRRPGTSTCSTSTSTTTTSPTARRAHRALPRRASRRDGTRITENLDFESAGSTARRRSRP